MTDTTTLTLTAFLLARIAEDEAMAKVAQSLGRWALPENIGVHMQNPTGEVVLSPARVLAQCEAHRRIVEFLPPSSATLFNGPPLLRILAAIYADHPDYDESWRP